MRALIVIAALALSVWWVLFVDVHRGRILYMFTATHGIDESDLLTIPFLAIVGWFVWPRRRAR